MHQMQSIFIAVGSLVGILVFIAARGRRQGVIARPLMTPNEIEFYGRLITTLPHFHVFPQVSFGALMTHTGMLAERDMWRVRASFDRKIADYVVCDRGMTSSPSSNSM